MQHGFVFIFPVLALIALTLVVAFAGLVKARSARGHYRAMPLLSPAEILFFQTLKHIYGGSVVICPKVRLSDLVKPSPGLDRSQRRSAQNQISQKHVDFVLLHPDNFQVFGVLELDDRTHLQTSREARDRLVDGILGQAGIPICHVKARGAYDPMEIQQAIEAAFRANG